MIRVTARHLDDDAGILVGDMPPSEIRPLLELLAETDIYYKDRSDVGLNPNGHQFTDTDVPGAPRLIFEILLEGGS